MARQVGRAFTYHFYPTAEQATEPPRMFGCVRLVCSKALEERTRPRYGDRGRLSCTQSSAALMSLT